MRASMKATVLLAVMLLVSFSLAVGQDRPMIWIEYYEVQGLNEYGCIPEGIADLVIPVPFTKAYCGAGAPIHVPQGLPRNELEPYRAQLQQAMDDLQAYLDALAEGRDVDVPQPPEINWKPLSRAA